MEYIISWIKNIAVFYIIASLINNIIPDNKYRKYIKLFLGIVMIIMLIKPVGELLNMDGQFELKLMSDNQRQMSWELAQELSLADEDRALAITGEYVENISNNIEQYCNELGIEYIASDVEIDTNMESEALGSITYIGVEISTGTQLTDNTDNPSLELNALRLKNYISDFYNIEKHNIYVNIKD